MFGGDVESWTGETVWSGELGGEKEGKEKLSFACSATYAPCFMSLSGI